MLQKFITYLTSEKRYSGHSIKAYKKDLMDFENYLKTENLNSLNVRKREVRNYIIYLSNQKISTRSINRKISAIKAYYKFLEHIGEIEDKPTIGLKALKVKKEINIPLTHYEMNEKFTRDAFKKDFTGIRNYLIIQLLYQTGMRRAELISLKKKDIDLEQKEIKVLGKRNKQRIIPITQNLTQLIKEYLSLSECDGLHQDSPFIIRENGKEMYPKLVYNIVNTYLSAITDKKKTSPHILRHSFATHMLNEGAEINAVKEVLGHAGLASTQVYTHHDIGQLKKVFNQAHPRKNKN